MTATTKPDCRCQVCVDACKRRPGWFAPGQAEVVAARLGKSVANMLGHELVIDYWVESRLLGGPDTFLLAPNTEGWTARVLRSWPPQGRCVFLDAHDRCKIHDIKPYECRQAMPCDDTDQTNHHEAVADLWRTPDHQAAMNTLLGRDGDDVS